MITLRLPARVFLCTTPTDMRKSFDSLAMLVTSTMASDPLAGDLFVFKSKRGDRIKLLYWDGDGYALWYKSQVSVCTHSFPFTAILELGDNLIRWIVGTGTMG
ncbi:MAG TPA: IS66 family insertion sequence element accessory protein TnpB [Gemmatales bacterium]|nr:IS66 family insertion sequence element accessory protein TnpB [Gemmatales bacterium]